MHNKQFYPSYIPGKWIHYTRHKKKRIRKKYQNRIRREVRHHKVDAQTLSFLLADMAARYSDRIGYNQTNLSRVALLGGSWCNSSAAGLLTPTVPQIAIPPLPQITAPELEIPEIPETTQDALERLGKALVEVFRPVVEYVTKVIKKLFKWVRDIVDHLWCNNRRWWYMAEHHKKRRIRKNTETKSNAKPDAGPVSCWSF